MESERHFQMYIANEKGYVSYNTEKLEIINYASKNFNKGNYIIRNTSEMIKKPVGHLLFSLLNSDFNTKEGFELFWNEWGLPGLLEITKLDDVHREYAYKEYGPKEYQTKLSYFYDRIKSSLVDAQIDFKEVVNYCLNENQLPYLDDLSPLQRYYVGIKKDEITRLDGYSNNYFVSNEVQRNNLSAEDAMEEFNSTVEELSNSLKDDTFIIRKRYYTQNILTFVYIEFFNLLKNFSIDRCSNCNKYFVPSRVNEIYCDDCRHIGYINKIKNNELLKIYNTAYKTKFAQIKRKTSCKTEKKKEAIFKLYEMPLRTWRKDSKTLLHQSQIKYDSINNSKEKEKICLEFKNILDKELEV